MTRSALFLAVLTLTLSAPILAGEATGGLRYSITVTEFENKAGWSGHYNIGWACELNLYRK